MPRAGRQVRVHDAGLGGVVVDEQPPGVRLPPLQRTEGRVHGAMNVLALRQAKPPRQ